VDESATGSVNFFWSNAIRGGRQLGRSAHDVAVPPSHAARVRRVLVSLVAVALLAGGGIGASASAAPLIAARSCSAGYRHAVIGGAERCLRAGEFCAHAYDGQYRRYGFRCTRYYANVQRYRLTHS
jgi:hypothetical protein